MALDLYFRKDIKNVLCGLAASAGKSFTAQGSTNIAYWEGVRDTLENVAIAFGIPEITNAGRGELLEQVARGMAEG